MVNRSGVILGFGAYLLWSVFPLYFRLLDRSGPIEIVAHRAFWAFLSCVALVLILRRGAQVAAVLRDRRATGVLILAGSLVALNWTLYVWGVNTGRTLDAALGYFINPLVVALLGVLVLKERMRRAQWVAFGFGATAVVVLVVAYGQVPIIALGVAITFGFYGLVKKQVGARAGVISGMVVENVGIAVAGLVVMALMTANHTATVDLTTGYGWLVALAGPITAAPLLLFAASAKRVDLVTLGTLQYVAPIGQFLIGWLLFHEAMPAQRWAGFALVWVALVIFVADGIHAGRTQPRDELLRV